MIYFANNCRFLDWILTDSFCGGKKSMIYEYLMYDCGVEKGKWKGAIRCSQSGFKLPYFILFMQIWEIECCCGTKKTPLKFWLFSRDHRPDFVISIYKKMLILSTPNPDTTTQETDIRSWKGQINSHFFFAMKGIVSVLKSLYLLN